MSIYEDPCIVRKRIQNLLLEQPPQVGFDWVSSHIAKSVRERDAFALRDVIEAARAFVELRRRESFVEKLRDFYGCTSEDDELDALTRSFFTDYPPSKTGVPHTDVQNAQVLISQPLGVQKAMARSHIRGHQEALLFSPWPQVIEILCANPDIQQRDVVFMASRRPSMNELLEPILLSPWSARVEVRFALAANPAFCVSHAMRCAISLPADRLAVIAEMPELHGFLRNLAIALMRYMRVPERIRPHAGG